MDTDRDFYVRMAQAVLERTADRPVLSRLALKYDGVDGVEAILACRVERDAARLGRSLAELFAWLDQATERVRPNGGAGRDGLLDRVNDVPRVPFKPTLGGRRGVQRRLRRNK